MSRRTDLGQTSDGVSAWQELTGEVIASVMLQTVSVKLYCCIHCRALSVVAQSSYLSLVFEVIDNQPSPPDASSTVRGGVGRCRCSKYTDTIEERVWDLAIRFIFDQQESIFGSR
jgi:hypothetical protein